MRLLLFLAFGLVFALVGAAIARFATRRRIVGQGKRMLAEAKKSAQRTHRSFVEGQLSAETSNLDFGPTPRVDNVVAFTHWIALRSGTRNGAVVERSESAEGLALTTPEGTIALGGAIQVSVGHFRDLSKGAARTSAEAGDRALVLVPSVRVGYRRAEVIVTEPDERATEIFVVAPRVRISLIRMLTRPAVIIAAILGAFVFGGVYGGDFVDTQTALPADCRILGQCQVATVFATSPLSSRALIGALKGDLFTTVAGSDAECTASDGCALFGQCSARNGKCVVAKPDDCRYTTGCLRDGRCSAFDGVCAIKVDADCPSKGCHQNGACAAVSGSCEARSDADCQQSSPCSLDGLCSYRSGACDRSEKLDDHGSCRESIACLTHGTCTNQGNRCIAQSDADCLASEECALGNLCQLDPGGTNCLLKDRDCSDGEACRTYGRCRDGGSAGCVAASDADCKKSLGCKEHGQCNKIGEECVDDCHSSYGCRVLGKCAQTSSGCDTATAAGCLRSRVCREDGDCSVVDGACRAATDADCRQSLLCKTEGKCVSRDGRCEIGNDADCRALPACKSRGLCSAVKGTCVAGSDADCKDSIACRVDFACVEKNNVCSAQSHAATCRASDECRVLGHCNARTVICEAESDDDCQSSEVCKLRGWCVVTRNGDCFWTAHDSLGM